MFGNRKRVGVQSSSCLLSLALSLSGAASLYCREAFTAGPGRALASSQPAQRDYHFEVASIRPADPPTGREVRGPSYTPVHYTEEKISLAVLVWKAFDIRHRYQYEAPSWMASTYFSVKATIPQGATKDDLPLMIQHLLEDRFGMVVHHVTRQMTGYELVVAKSGSKFTRSIGSAQNGSAASDTPFTVENGTPRFAKNAGPIRLYSGSTAWWQGRNNSMQELALNLADQLDELVIDATALQGGYDYTLNFALDTGPGPLQVPANGGQTSQDYPLLRNALPQQLGLELRRVKYVPVGVVVVDKISKTPTDN